MAILPAYPEFKAGEGDLSGLHGIASEWPYIVEVEFESDNPIVEIRKVAELGDMHPDPHFKDLLYVSDYRKGEHLNEKTWRIYVTYSGPSERTIGLWRRSGRFGSETKQLRHSIGYWDAAGNIHDLNPNTDSKRIGTSKYVLPVERSPGVPVGDPWKGRYITAGEPGLKLNVTDEVDPTTGTVEKNSLVIPLSYEITVVQLTVNKIQEIASFGWCTNKWEWPRGNGAYEAWSLIFSGFAWEDEVLLIGGVGPIWFSHCQVELLYKPVHPVTNRFGWRGERRYDAYNDGRGNLSDVGIVGTVDRATRDYVINEERSFNSLFGAIGGSVPNF